MSRIDYSRKSPRRNSPIRNRLNRSRSRERYSRRSPLFGRNRLSIHQRLSDRSVDRSTRSIEKRICYPSKFELERRSFRHSSRSPRRRSRSSRRRRSSSKSSRRSRSRSSRRPRSRIHSRSRSKEETRKFVFSGEYNLAIDSNEFLDNQNDEFLRLNNFSNNNFINNNDLPTSNYLPSALIDRPILNDKPVLHEKIPLLERPSNLMFDNNSFNEQRNEFLVNDYYGNPIGQFNHLSQMNHLNDDFNQFNPKMNQLNPYSNPNIPDNSEPFHHLPSSNLTRSIRDRLDVAFPSTSSNQALLEPTSHYNLNNNGPPMTNLNSNNMNSNLNNQLNNLNNNNQINNIDNNNGYFSRSQDVDLRNSNNNNGLLGSSADQSINNKQQMINNNSQQQESINQTEKCVYSHLGCPISTSKELIDKHELDCLYNPKNVKAFCNKCKLIVCPEHDCIHELRTELNLTKIKTNWCHNTVKLTNTSLLNDMNEQIMLSVHYSGDKEIVKQIKINKSERIDFVLKQAVDIIFTKESLMRQNKTDRDFQLICTGLYTFLPELSFNKSTKLQLPCLDGHLHLILIDKKITLKVMVKRLFYENQHIIVSAPALVPFSIDPTKRIIDLKDQIAEKIPIQWSKHRLTINGKEFQDYQIIYTLGLDNGDRVEIEAY